MKTRLVLVVEDDPAIRRGLRDALTFAGHRVLEAADGTSALQVALTAELDLVLLDVMLPAMDGFQVLAELRRHRSDVPVIMVTARGAEADCVKGLKVGADDYVVKPFSAKELLARVDAVLRRTAARAHPGAVFSVAGRRVDLDQRTVTLDDGTDRELSEKESQVLRYLAGYRGRPVGRDELLRGVWGIDPRGVNTRTVDMHIARLREKLGDDSQAPEVIRTVRSKGYMLVEHPSQEAAAG